MNPRIKKLIPFFSIIAGIGITGLSIGSVFKTDAIKGDLFDRILNSVQNLTRERPEERVYLQLDKSFYKPGESIWFKAYVRNAQDLTASTVSDILHVDLINPKGSVEKHIELICKKGMTIGDFQLTNNAAGGLYKIKAYTNWQKNEPNALLFEKELTVQNVILPSILMKLDFNKKAFGGGDLVSASVEFKSIDNKVIASKDLRYIVLLDGGNFLEVKERTDENGKANISFRLPKNLETNDGLLNILIEHDGKTESISRSIPIELNTIDLTFFPEGGDLVAGFSSKVAFKALNSFSKPADVEGYVVNTKGNKIASFCSFHHGMGAFFFKPEDGESYTAHITKPSGITTTYQLPEASSRGYLLSIEEKKQDQIILELASTEKEVLSVVGSIRDKVVYTGKTALVSSSKISINTANFPMGIIKFTLFDSRGIERAERLAFVNQHKQLKISLSTDKEKYLPREKVKLSVKITDDKGIPMPGNFSLSVVDEKLLSFADDRSGTILSKLFLESDIKEKVEEPSFYFDSKQTKSELAMDYLLLTSGWRRFTWEEILENELPAMNYQVEKAILGGSIIDNYNGDAIANAKIEIAGKNISTFSDKNGKFQLPFVDLTETVNLIVSANGYSVFSTQVNQYNSNIECTLYNRHYRSYDLEAPAMNEMGAADVKKAPQRAIQKMKGAVLENDKEFKMLKPEVKADEEVMEEVIEEMEIMAEPELIMMADTIAPMNRKMLWAANETMLTSKYYRARQYPSVNYNNQSIPEVRTDFRSTIYWDGMVETDRTGKATIEFYNSDEISSYRITMEGFGADGMAGRNEKLYYTQLPFSMSVKSPAELISGDKVSFPLTLKNNTTSALKGNLLIELPATIKSRTSLPSSVSLAAGTAKTIFIEGDVLPSVGKGKLKISFSGLGFSDAFEQEINVQAKGFPVTVSLSGKDMEKEYSIPISHMVDGSMDANFTAYPSLMTDLLKGIESIIREPYGCFEQTSTSNYPNVLIKRYLHEMGNDGSEAGRRKYVVPANLEANLEKGYDRLISYETKEKGYEWFGGTPAHEALTAYGLMQFNDMKTVYNKVDQSMIDRTANWLMARRDGEGGFKKSTQALDQFGRATEDITNAYIVYALSEAGYKDIRKEADKAYDKAIASKDAYQLALAANTMSNLKELTKAGKALRQLEAMQQKNGSWTGLIHSITCSTGNSLSIETTSLAIIAMIKAEPAEEGKLTDAVKYLVSSRSAYGGFGSTQGTVLALKALTAYTIHSKRTDEDGTIVLYIDGKKVAEKEYKAGETGEIKIEGLTSYLTEGPHKIKVKYIGVKDPLPYTLGIKFHTTLPPSASECKVNIQTKITETTVKTGETSRLSVQISNKTKDGLPMTMGIIGIPAGLSPQPWQLKELQEKKLVDFYEVRGNNVYLYFRQMAPSEMKSIHLDLKAEVPGEFEAPASCTYLYYTNEFKNWTKPDKIKVVQ